MGLEGRRQLWVDPDYFLVACAWTGWRGDRTVPVALETTLRVSRSTELAGLRHQNVVHIGGVEGP